MDKSASDGYLDVEYLLSESEEDHVMDVVTDENVDREVDCEIKTYNYSDNHHNFVDQIGKNIESSSFIVLAEQLGETIGDIEMDPQLILNNDEFSIDNDDSVEQVLCEINNNIPQNNRIKHNRIQRNGISKQRKKEDVTQLWRRNCNKTCA